VNIDEAIYRARQEHKYSELEDVESIARALADEVERLRERDQALQSLLLNNVAIRTAFERAFNFIFQAPGMYDGAMSIGCKQQFEREHQMICLLLDREPTKR